MTRFHVGLKGAAAAALALGCAGIAAAEAANADLARSPGLWAVKLTLDDGKFTIPDSELCLDARADRRMTIVGPQMRRSACSTYEVAPQPSGGWTLHSVCRLGDGARVETSGIATGDLASAYKVTATAETTGSPNPLRNGRHQIVVDARRVGPCAPHAKGGDITVNDRTSNVFSTPG